LPQVWLELHGGPTSTPLLTSPSTEGFPYAIATEDRRLRVRGMRIDHLRFRLIHLNIYGHNGITPRLFWDSLMGLFLRVFSGTGMRNLPHDAFEVLFGASDNYTVRFAERMADPDADKSSVSQYFSWGRDKHKDTAPCHL
jgi:hypothetical protein